MKIFLVGGAVRDKLLSLPVRDRDWVVIGATPELMLKNGFQPIGRYFPVFLHPTTHEEYALARSEHKNGRGYTGFLIKTTPDVTLEQDLQRRDLTINAIAQDENGELFDPYGGRKDLENRILRHVSSSFNEDPLRVLRVARFAARFAHLNFNIAKETEVLLAQMTSDGELKYLTVERVWEETKRALLTANPQVYFQVLNTCNALKVLFPELDYLYKISSSSVKYKSYINTNIHTLMSLTIASKFSNSLEVRFATLFSHISIKMVSSIKIYSNLYNLESINIIKQFCQRLHIPNNLRDLALIITKFNNVIFNIEQQSAKTLITLFNQIDAWRKPSRIEHLALLSDVNTYSRFEFKNIKCCTQGNYLRQAFKLTQSISIKDVVDIGFKGEEIRKELTKRRVYILQKKLFNLD
ncbi:multifunctional CCA addition/repair protein [Pantoea sp. Mhis]|uniref:multifunctional CCA addition/repair protein n=1 Tax=Pantoea sp. Mhis TaxID=2576759 RepID=UPI001358D45C|nr:multifunctional CCA addition/repair protein [Pantoea sp. Mhis]MXP56404.1 multifunctional CCA addition/repair protein [Pantoea sp. Mhis]